MPFLDLYKKSPYESLEPESVNTDQMFFKFKSPTHLLSWVRGLNGLPRTNTSMKSSETGNYVFTLSKSLDDAYDVISETKFDPNQTDMLEARISELKRGSLYSDEGHELEMPEFLAGSDKVWLKTKVNRKPTRIIDDILIIDSGYNAGCDSDTMKQMGIEILTSIYRRRVIPRKVVIMFVTNSVRQTGGKQFTCSVDVNFMDLNGIAKMLHPSMFRRIVFRLLEIYPDLTSGYGHA